MVLVPGDFGSFGGVVPGELQIHRHSLNIALTKAE
jgi:hypothetical protein